MTCVMQDLEQSLSHCESHYCFRCFYVFREAGAKSGTWLHTSTIPAHAHGKLQRRILSSSSPGYIAHGYIAHVLGSFSYAVRSYLK